MKRNYNYQAFIPDEVEQGLHLDLINYLLEHNKKNREQYYDIHITSDGYCTIVEWADVSYNNEYGDEAKFVFLDYDEVVMKEVHFPDDHYEYVFPEEVEDRLKEWHEQHPEWVKNHLGMWTNMKENERLLKENNNGD